MNRRRWLLGLIVADALCWVIYVVPSLMGSQWNISFILNGYVLSDLFYGGLVVLFPVVIGAFCSRWQAAVTLPVIATAHAVLVSLLTTQVTVGGMESLMLLPAALGGFGWLLRHVRAEFTESDE